MDEPVISARKLTKTYGEGAVQVRAVRGVDLEVRRGEVVLIMGASGSGKTTFPGLQPARRAVRAGERRVRPQPVRRHRPPRQGAGQVPARQLRPGRAAPVPA